MATASAHSFFAASASVAGALIGLLFVARSWDLVGGTKISLLRVLVARRHNDEPPNGGLGGE